MIQLKIDNCPTDISEGSWEKSRIGELVHSIYEELPENRVITRVLLNGAPLDANERERQISSEEVGELEIRTADKLVWEANGVDTCLSILERVQTSLIRTAELFRTNDRARANRFFAQCIESLEKFLDSMTITRMVCKLNFANIKVDGTPLTKTEETLTVILKSVLESQEQANYDELADKIEFELITNLYNWKTGLQEIKKARESNA